MKKTDVIEYFGTQQEVSNALAKAGYAISQPAVSKWGELIPEIPARILSEITSNELSFDPSVYRKISPAA